MQNVLITEHTTKVGFTGWEFLFRITEGKIKCKKKHVLGTSTAQKYEADLRMICNRIRHAVPSRRCN